MQHPQIVYSQVTVCLLYLCHHVVLLQLLIYFWGPRMYQVTIPTMLVLIIKQVARQHRMKVHTPRLIVRASFASDLPEGNHMMSPDCERV